MTTLNRISADAQELVNKVRQYSREQRTQWNHVPFWALEADGRDGYTEDYKRAYSHGLWNIDNTVAIDLESGELVQKHSLAEGILEPARDYDIIAFTLHPDIITAAKVLEMLKVHAAEPMAQYMNARADEIMKHREAERKRYGLPRDCPEGFSLDGYFAGRNARLQRIAHEKHRERLTWNT
jgi:hypothetical protein